MTHLSEHTGPYLVLGDIWRSLRRGAHEVLNLTAAKTHRPLQDSESSQLMYELLTTPEVRYIFVELLRCTLTYDLRLLEIVHVSSAIRILRYFVCCVRQARASVHYQGGEGLLPRSTHLGVLVVPWLLRSRRLPPLPQVLPYPSR